MKSARFEEADLGNNCLSKGILEKVTCDATRKGHKIKTKSKGTKKEGTVDFITNII
jgi:hypothetical protein